MWVDVTRDLPGNFGLPSSRYGGPCPTYKWMTQQEFREYNNCFSAKGCGP